MKKCCIGKERIPRKYAYTVIKERETTPPKIKCFTVIDFDIDGVDECTQPIKRCSCISSQHSNIRLTLPK